MCTFSTRVVPVGVEFVCVSVCVFRVPLLPLGPVTPLATVCVFISHSHCVPTCVFLCVFLPVLVCLLCDSCHVTCQSSGAKNIQPTKGGGGGKKICL